MRLPLVVLSLLAFAAPAGAATPRFAPCRDDGARADHARCGTLGVPLDRTGAIPGVLPVYFELYRRTDTSTPAVATIVSMEGGPGYSTTNDRDSRLALDGPLRAHRDLLLMDERGTGRSAPVDCTAFDRALDHYVQRAAACGRQLGAAADLYSTHQGVEDLNDILDALHVGKIDLYGDSYGSYFAESFALYHPQRLRTLTLDGTYPLPGTDPMWSDLAAATALGLVHVCVRAATCPVAPSAAVATVERLVRRVGTRPIVGSGPDGDGNPVRVRIDQDTLAQTLMSGYANFGAWRDILAAVHAQEQGDPAPLLRLVAENSGISGGQGDVRASSEGEYLAVICHDYPQPWDVHASFATRAVQFAAARARLHDAAFAPSSARAWTGTDYEGVDACIRWPAPTRDDPPAPPGATYPSVPTLIFDGDLDNITALSGAREVARRFPNSTLVVTRNQIHVSALVDHDGCAAAIEQRFVRTGRAGDTSCAARIAEVRVVRRFVRHAAEATPARRASSDRSRLLDRRVAAVAAETVADAIERWQINYDGDGVGLRGGAFSYGGNAHLVTFQLTRLRFAADVAVSGVVRWAINGGAVRATLRVQGPGGLNGTLRAAWSQRGLHRQASLRGVLGGRRLHAVMLAP